MARRYEDRYGRSGYGRDPDRAHDRGYMERAADEVRSWFGDDEAERRRAADEYRDETRPEWQRDNRDRSAGPTRREWEPARYAERPRTSRSWSTDDGRAEFGTGFYGRGPKGYQRSDSRIHEDVCDRLTFADVDAENIEVSVSSGDVTLSGTVHDRWDKRRAEDIAEAVAGVRDVHNNIRVEREPGSALDVNPTEGSHLAGGPAGNRR